MGKYFFLDGHTTHTKNIKAIELAGEYGIVMLSFSVHTTHRLQPLDISFFKSLKTNYKLALLFWLRTNPGNAVKQTTVSELLGIAYSKSVRKEIALNGFKFEGVSPCDRHKCDYDFYTPTLATKDSLRTPPFDISSQEQLSMVAVEKSREMYEEERKTFIDQIKLQLNILSLFPIINKVQNFGER
ncbi:jerky [Schistosoma japonicum]|uniref:Jerky n=1 Tax=Schistosoma japonicum TaxID=6182 RepID=A0A4Z2CNW6_SCHJA|nr:jerky [Schistosoma japonicum]